MNLKDHFLVAMPSLDEEPFTRSVVYICEHNHEGSMGIIINKPIENLFVDSMLSQLDMPLAQPVWDNRVYDDYVYFGGPLASEHGFIIHTPMDDFTSSIKISDDIMITTSQDILRTLGTHKQPENAFVALGYAGWAKDQIEQEIINDDWLVIKADPEIIFSTPFEMRWNHAAHLLGINIATITTQNVKIQ